MLPQNYRIFRRLAQTKYISNFCRCKSSSVNNAVFLEKGNEGPVVTLLRDEVDLIGPPDPVSNLRPVIRKRFVSESKLQEQLRSMQDATYQWNQHFWLNHNTKFVKERQQFIDSHQEPGEEKRQLSAEEMSIFYKKFLDEHWKTHLDYNFEWYKKNFTLLFLALRVSIEKSIVRIL